ALLRMAAEEKAAVARKPRQGLQPGKLRSVAIGLVERHAGERPVRRVGPGVVGADEVARVAGGGEADLGAAVAAAVVEGMDAPVDMACNDDAVPGKPRGEEIARPRHLAL